MNQILDRLWLGDFDDAVRFVDPACWAAGSFAVLTLCETPVPALPQVTLIHAPIPDEVCLPREVWAELLHALTDLLRGRTSVLVHCRLGVSRSPALVAAYLAQCGHSADLDAAVRFVVARRSLVRIHPETLRGVREYWEAQ